jgi:hypothetical protein
MVDLGLSRVKTLLSTERSGLGDVVARGHFPGSTMPPPPLMNVWTPMTTITRVRL